MDATGHGHDHSHGHGHAHGHGHSDHDWESEFSEEAWDERYRARPKIWSGRANPVLVTEVAELPAGTALDAGSGEGGDAFWLAARGWKVTGADLSTLALSRAAATAEELGHDIAWLHIDLSEHEAPGTFDLVTAHYLHLPPARRPALFAHLAAAVGSGGTLLVVGHDLNDLGIPTPRPGVAETGWTAADVAASLGAGWAVEVAERRPRRLTAPDGREIDAHDVVLRARRAGSTARPLPVAGP
ncbi:class I SAM-dependent methyltransferase [Frankia sp. R43]|uniref:class I SAM-dependent methyltransferase n=1 Tax=Frankia sp. R43 TaxID=269536 RepID=UPI000B17D205|nr:class I SAM-dependent methyltransferase [Frankia sp. R43]